MMISMFKNALAVTASDSVRLRLCTRVPSSIRDCYGRVDILSWLCPADNGETAPRLPFAGCFLAADRFEVKQAFAADAVRP